MQPPPFNCFNCANCHCDRELFLTLHSTVFNLSTDELHVYFWLNFRDKLYYYYLLSYEYNTNFYLKIIKRSDIAKSYLKFHLNAIDGFSFLICLRVAAISVVSQKSNYFMPIQCTRKMGKQTTVVKYCTGCLHNYTIRDVLLMRQANPYPYSLFL